MKHSHEDAIETLLRRQFDGAIADEGFAEGVMQRLPARRRRVVWPLWAGILAGTAACWLSLLFSPLLHAGWHDWADGELSAPAITLLLAIAGMALLAFCWVMMEADR